MNSVVFNGGLHYGICRIFYLPYSISSYNKAESIESCIMPLLFPCIEKEGQEKVYRILVIYLYDVYKESVTNIYFP